MSDKSRAFSTREWTNRPLMQPGVHSALLISRLVSISSRKPLSFPRQGRILVALDEDGTSSFISSLHLRPAVPLRISWTAIEPRSPLGLRAGTSLSQVVLRCVFCLSLPVPRATRVSCPSLSSVSVFAGDFFRPRLHLARSSAPRRFFSFLTPGLGP